MSIFKNIINAWKSDDLLSQAWEESLSMLMLSQKIFVKSIKYLNSGVDIESVKDLKSVYNVVSYKALDKINDAIENITSKLYNLYKVNIETDTGFFIST